METGTEALRHYVGINITADLGRHQVVVFWDRPRLNEAIATSEERMERFGHRYKSKARVKLVATRYGR